MRKLALRRETLRPLTLLDVRLARGGRDGSGACQQECTYARSGCSGPTDAVGTYFCSVIGCDDYTTGCA